MITLLFLICFALLECLTLQGVNDKQMDAGFTTGEKLEYVAKYSFLTIGSMTLEIKDSLIHKDFDCYHFCSVITSNPDLKFLFSLNDTVEVYARTHDLLPVFYRERINEGKYFNDSNLFFNHDSLFVLYDDSLRIDLLVESRDLLSFWYYLRTLNLIVGDSIRINIHKSKENFNILCRVKDKERIKTPLGEFRTILVSPSTEGKGIFGEGGGMDIWYSDDEARYPVQIRAKMKFGSVLFKLKEVKN